MTSLPDARLLNPMVVSGLLAAVAASGSGLLVPPAADPAAATLIERLVHNPFVMLIGFVGVWALLYGLIQLWATEAQSSGGLGGWLSGQGHGPDSPKADDPALAASLFAERWDHLAARRMAPLSYAVWVLPLLGFIGTVIGISEAIGGLGAVFAEQDREDALQTVLAALRFAFDTTFAGLVLVIPVMALSTSVALAAEKARDRALAARFGTSVKAAA